MKCQNKLCFRNLKPHEEKRFIKVCDWCFETIHPKLKESHLKLIRDSQYNKKLKNFFDY